MVRRSPPSQYRFQAPPVAVRWRSKHIMKCSLIFSSISQRRCCRRGCFSRASGHYRRRRRALKAARTVVPVPTTRKHSHNPTDKNNCTQYTGCVNTSRRLFIFCSLMSFFLSFVFPLSSPVYMYMGRLVLSCSRTCTLALQMLYRDELRLFCSLCFESIVLMMWLGT